VLLLLTIQLLAAGSHRHPLKDNGADCPACQFAHHQPAGTPPAAIAALPVPELVGLLAIGVGVLRLLAEPAFLIPPSQAPPRRPA
jgi:hypothetical protein